VLLDQIVERLPVPGRFQRLIHEALKFGTVGMINAVIDIVVFNVFLPIGPLKAKVGATVVATTASYLMNRHWTFKHRDRSGMRREYTLFFGLNLVGLGIQLVVLGAAKYGLGFSEDADRLAFNIANCVGIVFGTVFRFWSYRKYVFKAAPAEGEHATAAAAAMTLSPMSEADALAIELEDAAREEIDSFAPPVPGPTPAPTEFNPSVRRR
jgi:putative flippase GtrA